MSLQSLHLDADSAVSDPRATDRLPVRAALGLPRRVLRGAFRGAIVILLVSMITFLFVDVIPGGPAYTLLGEAATPDRVAQLEAEFGLHRSVFVRYVEWLGNAVQGDLGQSLLTRQPVSDAILKRLPVTLEIALLAQAMALLLAVPPALLASTRPNGVRDRVLSGFAFMFNSSPHFVTGLLLSYVLSIRFGLFPVTGWTGISEDLGGNLRYAFLPALTLALYEAPVYMRVLRGDLVTTLREDFILAARAKGLRKSRIMLIHALRPSSFSLMTVSGVALGRLIGGTVIVESIFAIPGVGQLMLNSILNKDAVTVLGIVIVVAVGFLMINFAVDQLYRIIDPRVRAQRD